MRRRAFLGLVGWAVASRVAVRGQQASVPVVGILYSAPLDASGEELPAFRAGLSEAGYVEGRNVAFEIRSAENRLDRLPELAGDLVRRGVAVIFTASTAAPVLAAKAATTSIPIVFSMGADPFGIGAVASLARPGGNITGITVLAGEVIGKRLELLREIVRDVSKVAYLVNTANPAFSEAALRTRVETADRILGLRLIIANASSPDDIDRAFSSIVADGAQALLVGPDTLFQAQRDKIIALAARHAIPATYPWPEDVSGGGLFSYGADFVEVFQKAGNYVGRILKGERPADLPVQQPIKFKLAVNLRTAKALGIEMPASFVARADEVIE